MELASERHLRAEWWLGRGRALGGRLTGDRPQHIWDERLHQRLVQDVVAAAHPLQDWLASTQRDELVLGEEGDFWLFVAVGGRGTGEPAVTGRDHRAQRSRLNQAWPGRQGAALSHLPVAPVMHGSAVTGPGHSSVAQFRYLDSQEPEAGG